MTSAFNGVGWGGLIGTVSKEARVLVGIESVSDLGRHRERVSQVEMQGGCWEEAQT